MTTNFAQVGRSIEVPLRNLRLDPQNPRLPAQLQGGRQEDLAIDLDLGYGALNVAESIAAHGFFRSEPLIAVPSNDEPDAWIVVEGNRRLTALLGLSNESIRSQFPDPQAWDDLAARARLDESMMIPIVAVDDRKSVVPIIGFRHISGIMAWSPFAQARYVAKLVDEDHMNFAEVAKMIGIERTRAANLYRDQAIAAQAGSLGIETGPVESAFSLLTVAMSSTQLRDHIAAPIGSRLTPGVDPIPAERASELKEVLVWIFGDETHDPVVSDSRDIPKLGKVIGHPTGLAAIREGKSLVQARQIIDDGDVDTLTRLNKRLTTARNALRAAEDDFEEHSKSREVQELVGEIRDALIAFQIDDG